MKKILIGVAFLLAAGSAVLAGRGAHDTTACDGRDTCCKCTAENLPHDTAAVPECCPCAVEAAR